MVSRREELGREDSPRGGDWTWWGVFLWLPACGAFGGGVGWNAAAVSRVFAPLGVFPLLVGLVLGACLVGAMRLVGMGHRKTALVAAVLAGAAAVFVQHETAYREACRRIEEECDTFRQARATLGDWVKGRMPVQPDGRLDFLRQEAGRGREISTVLGTWTARGWQVWATWAADGLLLLIPPVAMVALALRRPFCRHCGSWYRTTRSGSLGSDAAQEAARLLGVAVPEQGGGAEYRLLGCQSGCGPTAARLWWAGSPAAQRAQIHWLDPAQRDAVARLLDWPATSEAQ